MPMFSSPSPLLLSNPSSPAVSASASPHHHHPHYQRSSFRQPQPAAQSSNNSYFFASSSSTPAFSQPINGLASTSAAAPGSGPGKRSREDDDDDDAQMSAVRDGSSSPPSQHALASQRSTQQRSSNNNRPIIHKKIRSFVAGQNQQNGESTGASSAAAAPVDLGKMLASLDRPELLSLLMRLLATSQDSSLPAQIQALLPAPSLESINATLNNLEAAIHQAIPLAGARAEYVWTRVRNPLNEFATTAIGLMEVLLQRRQQQQSPSTPSFNSANSSEVDADGLVHPTTAFAFLLDLTGRVLRIERALPPPPKSVFFTNTNASSSSSSSVCVSGSSGAGKAGAGSKSSSNSSSHTSSFLVFKHFVHQKESESNSVASQPPSFSLFGGIGSQQSNVTRQTGSSSNSADALVNILVPTLLAQWDTLLRRLSNAVNQQGRMFGQEVVLGWYRALNSLGSEGLPSPQSPQSNSAKTFSPTPTFAPRPSFGFGFGSNAPSSTSMTGFGFGAAASSSTSSSSFGFGSMSMPHQSQPQQQQAEPTHRVEEEALRVAMDWIRDVFEREIGWLVGLDKMRAAAAGSDMRS